MLPVSAKISHTVDACGGLLQISGATSEGKSSCSTVALQVEVFC